MHALDLTALPSLLSHLREEGARVLHLHSARPLVVARWAASTLRLPSVMTIHLPLHAVGGRTGWLASAKGRAYLWAERRLAKDFPDRIIHVARSSLDQARVLGLAPPGRTVLVENGVAASPPFEAGRGRTLRTSMGVAPGAPVVVCVARLDPQKGVDVLLDAIAGLGPEHRAAHFWLIGGGPRRASLERRARRLRLGERVRFLGFRSDVASLLAASDFFVLPSRAEALPLSLVEAMTAGLPCVVTDVGDAGRLVEEASCGMVVPPGDVVALARALERTLTDRGRWNAMGAAGNRRAASLTAAEMARGVEAVYRSLFPGTEGS